MFAPLPETLPTRLSDYLPERVRWVPPHAWPQELAGPFNTAGIRTRIPRYALEVRTAKNEVDPDRVRWLAQGSTIRSLDTRLVHLTSYRGVLWVVDGHHSLAAHLAAGTEHIPVKLVTAPDPPTASIRRALTVSRPGVAPRSASGLGR